MKLTEMEFLLKITFFRHFSDMGRRVKLPPLI